MIQINENIYGHKNRLEWIREYISKDQKGLEFGCGTGVMITAILLQEGYDIEGIDLDIDSINLGCKIFIDNNLNPDALICDDIKNLPDKSYDYIIASEVLEHISNEGLEFVIDLLKQKIKSNGLLLVTVPNGYGWFEFEDFIWKKFRFHSIFRFFKLYFFIERFKRLLIGKEYIDCKYPSSIANSPHVQRFTLNSIIKTIESKDFSMLNFRGSALFSGPFSNIFFTGFKNLMKFNIYLGEKVPKISSGFYIAFKRN